jgi:hypothetical protein
MSSTIIDDLRIEADSPSGAQRAGATVTVTVQFFNVGPRPRTVFFIVAEPFRLGLSTFRFQPRSWPTQVQPAARAGYIPLESDFHEIAPNSRLAFEQKLLLARNTPPGDLAVEWTYENKIESWPSKLPNGGEIIPGIWRGKLTHTFRVKVTRP